MIWVLVFLLIAYTVLIICLAIGFKKIDNFKVENIASKTKFSIVIPFRNEAKNLPNLVNSILKLNYPKILVEFIFVDDDSTDDSVAIIENFISIITNDEQGVISKQTNKKILPKLRIRFRILKNKRKSNSPKKDAITTAIYEAKYNWIITTDADCILPENWLNAFDNIIQKNNPKMIVAPVNYKVKNTFLEQFQLLDFMSMQGTTIGSFGINFPFLCNGANLAYCKNDFLKLNGFDGNDNIASGDDIFLFEKFLENDKNSVQYLKSKAAIVTTFPAKSWQELIQQRTRWAAKTSNFKALKVKIIGLIVLLTNAFVIAFLLIGSVKTIYIPFGLKLIADWFLLKPTLQFFNHKMDFIKWYIPASFWYPFFSSYVIFKTIFFKYKWKGRTFKK